VACIEEKKSAQDLVHIPERKRPPGKPRCRQDNIKMDFPSITSPSNTCDSEKFLCLVMMYCHYIKGVKSFKMIEHLLPIIKS
jgi:hypothetical protein